MCATGDMGNTSVRGHGLHIGGFSYSGPLRDLPSLQRAEGGIADFEGRWCTNRLTARNSPNPSEISPHHCDRIGRTKVMMAVQNPDPEQHLSLLSLWRPCT